MAETYAIADLNADRLLCAGERAKGWSDNLFLGRRSPEKKEEDGIFGEAGEIVTEIIAPSLTRHPDRFQDHEGTALLGGTEITGIIETKVLKEKSLEQAVPAINRSRSKRKVDWFILHFGDRENMTITPWALAKVIDGEIILNLL